MSCLAHLLLCTMHFAASLSQRCGVDCGNSLQYILVLTAGCLENVDIIFQAVFATSRITADQLNFPSKRGEQTGIKIRQMFITISTSWDMYKLCFIRIIEMASLCIYPGFTVKSFYQNISIKESLKMFCMAKLVTEFYLK